MTGRANIDNNLKQNLLDLIYWKRKLVCFSFFCIQSKRDNFFFLVVLLLQIYTLNFSPLLTRFSFVLVAVVLVSYSAVGLLLGLDDNAGD